MDMMTNWKRSCAALIPCFNEAAHIGAVVEGVRQHLDKVIVIDDGSSDATADAAARAGAEVICHSTNRGKGVALRHGWAEVRRDGFAWALSLDGDGQHAPEDIPKFFACAEQTSACLVIGNRMGQAGKIPWLRRWINISMSRCLSKMTGATLPDSQCGFRLAHLDTVLGLPLASSRFVIESETLVAFLAAGERVEFIPIQAIYGRGQSKICPLRDTWRWLRWWTAQTPATS